jgi:hypothetical protein
MIDEAGEIVKNYLDIYRVGGSGSNQFIDKLAGVVTVISKTDRDGDNKTVFKRFPVACGVSYADCLNGKYKDLVPNTQVGCITYLEEVAASFLGNRGRKQMWKLQFRLVCWMNKKKLGKDSSCSISSQVITTLMDAFPDFPKNEGNFQQFFVRVIGQDPKTLNPFSKYSYSEEINQHLMHPNEYFSLALEVTFEIDKSCVTPFEKETENDC